VRAASWLRDFLEAQPDRQADREVIEVEANAAGHSHSSLDRGADLANVRRVRRGFPARSRWMLIDGDTRARSLPQANGYGPDPESKVCQLSGEVDLLRSELNALKRGIADLAIKIFSEGME